ncbi:MAG: CBS domain-containing protein [Rhodospirillales bacterium]|nr:CBS domain-containing protein [Rhodospirillales bacterium]
MIEVNASDCVPRNVAGICPWEVDMIAHDVMTAELITANPDTPITEIAMLLVKHRIGAVPVTISDGRLVGIVSQTDLAHRSENDTEKRRNGGSNYCLTLMPKPGTTSRHTASQQRTS